MARSERAFLIVEDEAAFNAQLRMFVQIALRELPARMADRVKIYQAHSFSEALFFLDEYDIDFVSVDMALHVGEVGMERAQRQKNEAGGIRLLAELVSKPAQPITVVVSGEESRSYMEDTLRKYNVLNYYVKGEFDLDEYKYAVQAVFWYWQALQQLQRFDVDKAITSWGEVTRHAEQAQIALRNFPERVDTIVKYAHMHPFSGLPTFLWTRSRLKHCLYARNGLTAVARPQWTLIRLTLENFQQLISVDPTQADSVYFVIKTLLDEVAGNYREHGLFVGHFEQVDFPEPILIFIPDVNDIEAESLMRLLTKHIKNGLEQKADTFIPFEVRVSQDRAEIDKFAIKVNLQHIVIDAAEELDMVLLQQRLLV